METTRWWRIGPTRSDNFLSLPEGTCRRSCLPASNIFHGSMAEAAARLCISVVERRFASFWNSREVIGAVHERFPQPAWRLEHAVIICAAGNFSLATGTSCLSHDVHRFSVAFDQALCMANTFHWSFTQAKQRVRIAHVFLLELALSRSQTPSAHRSCFLPSDMGIPRSGQCCYILFPAEGQLPQPFARSASDWAVAWFDV